LALGESAVMDRRVIFCVDVDYFYAQCEELRNPALRAVPVVVCMYSARGEGSGAVATCNYIARRYGVRSGMPIYRARRLLRGVEGAAFISARDGFPYYEEKSAQVMAVLRSAADRFEQVSVDEAYLDVTQRVGSDFNRALELALNLKGRVKELTGLTCSVGVGPNKLLAKMAVDMKKPDGLTVVRPEEVREFLWPLPVGRLYGVGVKTEEKLREAGVSTIGDLARLPLERLVHLFGRSLGSYLYDAARGIDHEPVEEAAEVESISRMTTLRENTRDYNLIWPEMEALCEQVMEQVRLEGWMFRTISILLVMEDLTTQTRSHSLETPTNSLEVLKKVVRQLTTSYLREEGRLLVRRIGVKVSGLVRAHHQVSLREFL